MAVVFAVYLVLTFAKREVEKAEKDMDENNFVIRQPKTFFWVGIMCPVFFGGLIVFAIISNISTAVWWVYLVFSFFTALGLFLVYYCRKWELKVENNQITYSPVFGKKKSFNIDYITKVKFKPGRMVTAFNENKKLFSVEYLFKGFNVLVSRLKKEQINFE
jgi:hypothetical protein